MISVQDEGHPQNSPVFQAHRLVLCLKLSPWFPTAQGHTLFPASLDCMSEKSDLASRCHLPGPRFSAWPAPSEELRAYPAEEGPQNRSTCTGGSAPGSALLGPLGKQRKQSARAAEVLDLHVERCVWRWQVVEGVVQGRSPGCITQTPLNTVCGCKDKILEIPTASSWLRP